MTYESDQNVTKLLRKTTLNYASRSLKIKHLHKNNARLKFSPPSNAMFARTVRRSSTLAGALKKISGGQFNDYKQ